MFRSGFVSLVGRPNVGKSTLVNNVVGRKVSIVSDKPQTTRTKIRGVHTTSSSQIVLLDTPGIHRPRTLLGERCNERSVQTLREVDVVCLLVEADSPIGPGDRFIANLVKESRTPAILVVNKVDLADAAAVAKRLSDSSGLADFAAFVPISALTGDGVDLLVAEINARLPEGPEYYPGGVVTDQPEAVLVAELVREKLLAIAREELPHSIMVTAEAFEEEEQESFNRRGRKVEGSEEGSEEGGQDGESSAPEKEEILRFRVTIRVERDSQKGIVIGHKGSVLRDAGTAARVEAEQLLGARVYIENKVKVDPNWQRRGHALDRLGL
ncbi:MAG: GTPase Era [Actinobacteria bacterium]|nr:GTPase Era [Actinomycetota bacterium]MSZ29400.1 GTPase Era [Actinomycetota bacterium]